MTSSRRRQAENGYARGEETRAKIIETAISLFGEKGFAGVSTREISGAAGVPAPSIQYYFENKEGLYQACIEELHLSAWKSVGPIVEEVEGLMTENADADRLIDGYCRILERLADFLFGMPDAGNRALFVAQHRSATNWKRTGASTTGTRIHGCCTALVTRIAKDDLPSEEVRIIATTINGQLIAVHLAREHIEDMLGWSEITPDRLDALKAVVRRQVSLILNSYRSR